MNMKNLELVLLILIMILCIPAIPFMLLLDKLHKWNCRKDKPIY
jgi:hypothetical protein